MNISQTKGNLSMYFSGYNYIFKEVAWRRLKRFAEKGEVKSSDMLAWTKAIERSHRSREIIRKTTDIVSPLLNSAEKGDIKEWLRRETRDILRGTSIEGFKKFEKNLDELKKDLKEAETFFKKIKENIASRQDLKPLNFHLVWSLDLIINFWREDLEELKAKGGRDYYKTFKENLNNFPRKVLIFYAPLIAIHVAITGATFKQKARLVKEYRKIESKFIDLKQVSGNLPKITNQQLSKLRLVGR